MCLFFNIKPSFDVYSMIHILILHKTLKFIIEKKNRIMPV